MTFLVIISKTSLECELLEFTVDSGSSRQSESLPTSRSWEHLSRSFVQQRTRQGFPVRSDRPGLVFLKATEPLKLMFRAIGPTWFWEVKCLKIITKGILACGVFE